MSTGNSLLKINTEVVGCDLSVLREMLHHLGSHLLCSVYKTYYLDL